MFLIGCAVWEICLKQSSKYFRNLGHQYGISALLPQMLFCGNTKMSAGFFGKKKTTAPWNLVVEMLNLTNWLNKQVPGNNLQIEDQNLTFLDRIDSSNKTNPTTKCNADK